jgi:hypothetical protein
MLWPFNLVRLMALLGLSRQRQLRLMVAMLLLTILYSWRVLLYEAATPFDLGWLRQFFGNLAEAGSLVWTRDLSVFLLILLVWWRGLRLAARHHEINRMGLRLRVGGLIIAPLIIWFAANFLAWSVIPYLMLFFLAALTAVALVRVEQMEQEQSGGLATVNATWLATILGAALAIVLTAVVAASIVSGESLFYLLELASPMLEALQFGVTTLGLTLYYLGQPFLDLFAILLQLLATLLAHLFSLAGEGLQRLSLLAEVIPTPAVPTPAETVEATGSNTGSKVVVLGLMLAAVVLVSLALVRLYRQASFVARESARSHLHAPDDGEEDGRGRGILERLGLFRSWRAALSIRRIYQQMCRAAEGAGYPRPEFQTPYEYLPLLAQVWPENTAATRLITNAFVRVRYGEVPESREELQAIRAAWQQLEATEPNRRETEGELQVRLQKE